MWVKSRQKGPEPCLSGKKVERIKKNRKILAASPQPAARDYIIIFTVWFRGNVLTPKKNGGSR
jgi:hypothetical protein